MIVDIYDTQTVPPTNTLNIYIYKKVVASLLERISRIDDWEQRNQQVFQMQSARVFV